MGTLEMAFRNDWKLAFVISDTRSLEIDSRVRYKFQIIKTYRAPDTNVTTSASFRNRLQVAISKRKNTT